MLEFLALPLIIFWSMFPFTQKDTIQFFPDKIGNYNSISVDRPKSFINVSKFPKTTIFKGGDLRYELSLGDQFNIFRSKFHNRTIDYSFGGSVYQQYDLTKALDGIGYNGTIYSTLQLLGDKCNLELSVFHISSHLGDEYIENTSRRRLEYARNEFLIGIQMPFDKLINNFEFGYDYSNNIAAPKPFRFRNEVQLRINKSFYVAVNLESRQENDWSLNSTLQTGFSHFYKEKEKFRAYLEYYRGNSRLYEFYNEKENMFLIGFNFFR